MMRKIKKYLWQRSSNGQNMIEYLVVFVGVIVVIVAVAGPKGFFTKKIEESLDTAFDGTKCLALKVCYDPGGCPSVCGNGCCEADETIYNCPEDCSLCMSDADCDDGIACNGIETCDPELGCQPGGSVCANCGSLAHGESGTFYTSSTVSYGEICGDPVIRVCDDGVLNGSSDAIHPSCTTEAPASCGSSPHGAIETFYESETVLCGSSCVPVQQQCFNGTWNGPYTAKSCAEDCVSCPAPGGVTVPNGESRIYYEKSKVPCWQQCSAVQETRECINGVLTGSYTELTCEKAVCDDGIYCTQDLCVLGREEEYDWGCVHIPRHSWCDDGASCTGATEPGQDWIDEDGYHEIDPEPGWAVGDDWCDVVNGCQFEPVHTRCDDGISCSTGDYCTPSYSFPGYSDQVPPIGAYVDCSVTPMPDDNLQWSSECQVSIDATTGCSFYLDHTQCDDGVLCTTHWCDPQRQNTDDIDSNGCWARPQDSRCDDTIGCTSDWCHVTEDCQFQPNHGRCNDNFTCTGASVAGREWEGGGVTVPGWNIGDDYCDINADAYSSGCVFERVDERCDDGIDCTYDDVCDPDNFTNAASGCSNPPVDAYCDGGPGDDGIMCTAYARCDPSKGGCVSWPEHSLCNDGITCTNDFCHPSHADADEDGCRYVPEPLVYCTDVGECGVPVCEPPNDCQYLPSDISCDDGNPCNGIETCDPETLKCVAGTPECSDNCPENCAPPACFGSFLNASMCDGDDDDLADNTDSTLVDSCGEPKCEYTCNSGYTKSGDSCVPSSFSCTGTVPLNATMCPDADTGLEWDTPITVGWTCSDIKCQYECDCGYHKDGNTCVQNVCSGTDPSNATMCPGDDINLDCDNGVYGNVKKTIVDSCTDATKCEYTCVSPYWRTSWSGMDEGPACVPQCKQYVCGPGQWGAPGSWYPDGECGEGCDEYDCIGDTCPTYSSGNTICVWNSPGSSRCEE